VKDYASENWQKFVSPEELQACMTPKAGVARWTVAAAKPGSPDREHPGGSPGNRTPVKVLDVACFSGDYFGKLMGQQGMGDMLRYTGVDVTERYVENCKKRWAAYTNAEFRCGSAKELPFQDKAFDIVFNSGMLIHIDDPGRRLRSSRGLPVDS